MNKTKNWDLVTKTLLTISGIIILFSFASPYIFTQFSSNVDFTDTGQIGDTLGGIINPFIALSGIILTFLAFYMQIKANQIQVEQFNQTIKNEKDLKLFNDKYNSYNYLSLLVMDLEYIINDIKEKGIKIKEYIELENRDNLISNTLFRTPSIQYSKILEIDRLEIYKGFNFFINENKDIALYNQLYLTLNFLPEFFKSIYENYDRHSNNLLNYKNNIRLDLNSLLDKASNIINNFLSKSPTNYLEYPEVKICNRLIENYYEIVDESYDEKLNATKETDFNKLSNILSDFIKDALFIRSSIENYDREIEILMEKAAFIRKNINDAKQQKKIFVASLKKEYENLILNSEKSSILNKLIEIKNNIDNVVKKVDINNI